MISEEKQIQMLDELLDLCRQNLAKIDEEMIAKAFKIGKEAHKNEYRASGEPYFMHPWEVAKIIAREMPLDDVSVVSALLHDVVEDTDISLDSLTKEFGKEVSEIVDGVTKISGVFSGQEITQAENYRKMLLSMIKDIRVILVKFADRLHNMRTLEHVKPQKQRRIAQETLEIYAPFAHRFGLGRVKWELEDLAFKFMNAGAYQEIAKKIASKRKERESYISRFIKPISQKLEDHKIKNEMGGRAKHIYSIYRKMIKQNTTFEKIYDLLAVRIILESNDPNECYYVLGIINQMYTPIPDRFKDYISIPKKNNYQSIHNTVVGPDGKLVEIQIRTRKMHEIAEKGVAAHWKYKEELISNDSELEEWVNWVRDIFNSGSKSEATKEFLNSFKLTLYQQEIFVFTPKGDLRRLPINSTPVDFAYDIHSGVGDHCIGAKVNGKIVPLTTILHSGDRVEIITSKNQHPNKSWMQFVQTHKARANIRRYLNKEEEIIVENGKEIWERKVKKLKLSFSHDDIVKLSRKLKYANLQQFYYAIANDKIDLDNILNPELSETTEENSDFEFEKFADIARKDAGDLVVEGDHKGLEYTYAKCCNPIPGDPVIGYVTIGEGIKIHKKDCVNLISLAKNKQERLVPVNWPKSEGSKFVAGIRIRGEDMPGLLKEISNSVTSYKNTNIKSVNISTNDSMFIGIITVYVEDLEHLNRLMEKLKKQSNIYKVERFDAANQGEFQG